MVVYLNKKINENIEEVNKIIEKMEDFSLSKEEAEKTFNVGMERLKECLEILVNMKGGIEEV